MMAIYLVVLRIYGSLWPIFSKLRRPHGRRTFYDGALLVTLAVLPITLFSNPAPVFDKTEKSIPEISVSNITIGCVRVVLFRHGERVPIFHVARLCGAGRFYLPQISTFMAIHFEGVAMQFPIGHLSDKYDRRKVLIGVSPRAFAVYGRANGGPLSCFAAVPMAGISLYILYLSMFLIGGTALTIYGLACAHQRPSFQQPSGGRQRIDDFGQRHGCGCWALRFRIAYGYGGTEYVVRLYGRCVWVDWCLRPV